MGFGGSAAAVPTPQNVAHLSDNLRHLFINCTWDEGPNGFCRAFHHLKQFSHITTSTFSIFSKLVVNSYGITKENETQMKPRKCGINLYSAPFALKQKSSATITFIIGIKRKVF